MAKCGHGYDVECRDPFGCLMGICVGKASALHAQLRAPDAPSPSPSSSAPRTPTDELLPVVVAVPKELLQNVVAAMGEAALDCEAQARADFGDPPHPALKRKYDREMAVAAFRRNLADEIRALCSGRAEDVTSREGST